MLHIALHLIVPAIFTISFFPKHWKKAYPVMVATMLVDVDHLLATPIYDPMRCSINFHPLHSFWAIGVYVLLCLPKTTRYIGLGLLIHMALDAIDCQVNVGRWFS